MSRSPVLFLACALVGGCTDERHLDGSMRVDAGTASEDDGGLPDTSTVAPDSGPSAVDVGLPLPTCRLDPCSGLVPPACQRYDHDEATDECRLVAEADGTPCSDGEAATAGDRCVAGACVGVGGVPEAVGLAIGGSRRPVYVVSPDQGRPRAEIVETTMPEVTLLRLDAELLAVRDLPDLGQRALLRLDLCDRRLERIPVYLPLGSRPTWTRIPESRAFVHVSGDGLARQAWRVDLDPPGMRPLGALSQTEGQLDASPSDGRWFVRLGEGVGDGPSLIARRVDGDAPGEEAAVAALAGRPDRLHVLPGGLALVRVQPAPVDETEPEFPPPGRTWLVDLLRQRAPVDLGMATMVGGAHPTGRWMVITDEGALALLRLDGDWPPHRYPLAGMSTPYAFSSDGRLLFGARIGGQPVRLGVAGDRPGPVQPLVFEDWGEATRKLLAYSAERRVAIFQTNLSISAVDVPGGGGKGTPVRLGETMDSFRGLSTDGDAAWLLTWSPIVARWVPLSAPEEPVDIPLPTGVRGGWPLEDGGLLFLGSAAGVPYRLLRSGPDGPVDLLDEPQVPIRVVGVSDDGGLVVFRRGADPGIQAVSTRSGEIVRPAEEGEDVTIAPGGRRVVFWREEGDAHALHSARTDGADAPDGVRLGAGRRMRPVLSPDGRWAAWLAGDERRTLVAPLDASQPARSVADFGTNAPLAFVPDDTLLVEFHPTDSSWQGGVAAVPVAPTAPGQAPARVVVPLQAGTWHHAGLLPGPLVVLSRWLPPGEDGRGVERQLLAFGPDAPEPAPPWPVSPAVFGAEIPRVVGPLPGERLLVAVEATVGMSLEVVRADGSDADDPPTVLGPPERPLLDAPALDPAGRLAGRARGPQPEPDVYRLSIDGDEPLRLTPEDGRAERPLAWSADGRWVAHAGLQGAWQAVRATQTDAEDPVTLLAVPGQDVAFLGWVDSW